MVDGFTDEFLLEMASRVEGLRGPGFDAAVRTMKYQAFVVASEEALQDAGASALGTLMPGPSGVEQPGFEGGCPAYYIY
ncbi:hypothetical protein [Streptomyces sp. NPDC048411]|uniref:hypothetical protein n=1 Tax=Streptomyces sp. NPDC048411 TaxID=3157206 RepID=UPI0034554406